MKKKTITTTRMMKTNIQIKLPTPPPVGVVPVVIILSSVVVVVSMNSVVVIVSVNSVVVVVVVVVGITPVAEIGVQADLAPSSHNIKI